MSEIPNKEAYDAAMKHAHEVFQEGKRFAMDAGDPFMMREVRKAFFDAKRIAFDTFLRLPS